MPDVGLPPGPRAPALIQTLLSTFRFEAYSQHCRRRYGPLLTVRLLGLGAFVVVADPGLLKQVFTGDPDVLHGGEANATLSSVLANSVLLLDGDEHLYRRRLLLPPFHGEAVRRYADVMSEIAAADVARWPRGRPFAVLPRMRAITLEVILRAVVGVRDERRVARLRALLPHVGHPMYPIVAESARPALTDNPIGVRLPWVRARQAAARLFDEEIADHRADPEGREDILALLIAARDEDGRPLTDEELRGELFTLLLAGHETTATELAWCFERLVRHPEALARLNEEIDGGESEDYLDAVVNETLRSRPVIDAVIRKLTADLDLGSYRLPAGTKLACSMWSVQHSETTYAQPERFSPERFLEAPVAPYTLLPFGGGVRRCIGASFAVTEIKTVLRTVLQRVAPQPSTARPEKAARGWRVVMYPSRGARIAVRSRPV